MNSPARAESKAVSAIPRPRRRTAMTFGFQLRALFPVIICTGLFLAFTLFFVWLPMQRQLAADPSPVARALLSAQLFRVELWIITLLLISGGFGCIYALLRARHLAGPVVEVRDSLARLALGNTEPLALQPGDEFRELETPFNGVASRFDHITRNNLEMLRLLRRNLEGIAQRSADKHLNETELRDSIAVLLRDIDGEMKKLQMKS